MMLRYVAGLMFAFGCAAPLAAQTRPAYSPVAALADGHSGERYAALMQIVENPHRQMDDALYAALNKAATDTDTRLTAELARSVFRRWIWNAKPQDPRAIHLACRLAIHPNRTTRHNAVYFGLSTLHEQTDQTLAAIFAAAAMDEDYDRNQHGRIAWGLRATPPERIAAACEPYWTPAAADAKPKAAWVIYQTYKEATGQEPPQPERFADIKAKAGAEIAARKAAHARLMPEFARELREGDSKRRQAVMHRMYTTPHLFNDLDESILDALIVAADDPEQRVRWELARFVGNRWVWSVPPGEQQNPKAIQLAMKMSKDADPEVRHFAVYFGLSTVIDPSDEVIRTMLHNAIIGNDHNTVGRVAWSLKRVPGNRLTKLFEPYFAADANADQRARAAKLYTEITGAEAPTPSDLAAPKNYAAAFQDLYDHLARVYPAFEIKGIDWNKAGQELLPKAKDVKSDDEFGLLCMQLVARLEDSHATLLPAKALLPTIDFPRFDPGFACVIDDRDRPVVYTIDRGSPAQTAGVKLGMAIVSVNGKPAADALAACMRQLATYSGYSSDRVLRYDAARMFVRQMRSGADVRLVAEDVDGKQHGFDLKATLGVRYLPRLPVPIGGIDDSADVSWKMLDGDIGYIYVRRIRGQLIESLDRAVSELAEARGLIVDVRGNTGGGFDAQRALRNFDTNDGQEPHRPRFAGPIALLIDERTISAGEGWASWFIANKRARVFGTATAGASSRKAEYTLTNGLYKVIVPVKAYTGFLDRPIERRGLEPDVPIRVNAKDVAAGKDTVLEAARAHLMKTPAS